LFARPLLAVCLLLQAVHRLLCFSLLDEELAVAVGVLHEPLHANVEQMAVPVAEERHLVGGISPTMEALKREAYPDGVCRHGGRWRH
jgi:hypothetical protein